MLKVNCDIYTIFLNKRLTVKLPHESQMITNGIMLKSSNVLTESHLTLNKSTLKNMINS